MHKPKYCLFYDNHTLPTIPDVGETFDVDEFIDGIKSCGVDCLTFHARCNMGMAYYDTEIGIKHPSLKFDLFGQIAEKCQENNIALIAYINAGISQAEGLKNRNWTIIRPDGREYHQDKTSPHLRDMCYNTGYSDHLISMAIELLGKHPVNGLFLDCMGPKSCICPQCIKIMRRENIDYDDEKQLALFAEKSSIKMAERIALAVKKNKYDILMYFNGVPPDVNPGNYLECECLPTGSWGYEFLPVKARYLRSFGKPVVNMTARFHKSWGDFGGIRPAAGIEYDLFYGLANGMQPNIGDHFHPRGDYNKAAACLKKTIFTKIRQFDEWFEGAEPLTDVGVIVSADAIRRRPKAPVSGVVRMLDELKLQFDVIQSDMVKDLSDYKLLVLPDETRLDKELAGILEKYLKQGGLLISSAHSGLAETEDVFALEDFWGVHFEGDCDYDPPYIKIDEAYAPEIPPMPHSLYQRGTMLKAAKDTEVPAEIIAPYFNAGWDGIYPHYYLPPNQPSGLPALTIKENVAHFSHPIFEIYHNSAPVYLKQLLKSVIHKLELAPLLRLERFPSFARATVTGQPGRRIVHLISYLPEKRGPNMQVIEEPVELRDVTVSLRKDGIEISKVYQAPDKTELKMTDDGEYVSVCVPVVDGYGMVVFEQEKK